MIKEAVVSKIIGAKSTHMSDFLELILSLKLFRSIFEKRHREIEYGIYPSKYTTIYVFY